MPLEAVEARRLYRQIADQLRALIDSGEYTVGSRLPTERDLVAVMRRRPSIAAARRLGFLLELVRVRPNSDLLTMARSQEGVTRLVGDSVPNSTWRLFLPSPADSILRASR